MATYREGLENQIRESYGRVVYTYTSFHKRAERLKDRTSCVKKWQIILTAITSCGVVSTIFIDEAIVAIITAIISAAACGISLYFKEFDLAEEVKLLQMGVNELWLIKEKYISLLTDFPVLKDEQIAEQRDALMYEVETIYKKYPKTDKKSYKDAQKALKKEEEQYFTNLELNQMLPEHLRKREG